MEKKTCPMCEMDDVLESPTLWKYTTCGHERERAHDTETASGPRVVKDSNGNALADGDIVALIKDLPLKGASQTLKVGTKSKPIRLVEGDHEISCKMEGISIGLKACFVKK